MNRSELARLFASIKENAELAESVLTDPRNGDRSVDTEVVFRAAAIDTRLSQIRQQYAATRPNLHILGDRPGSDAA